MAQCEKAISRLGENIKIHEYETVGDAYYVDGKFYNRINDVWEKNNIKKRIYSIEEATKVSKETGNTFKLRYK